MRDRKTRSKGKKRSKYIMGRGADRKVSEYREKQIFKTLFRVDKIENFRSMKLDNLSWPIP